MDNKHPSAPQQPGAYYSPNFPPPNTNAQGYAQPPYVSFIDNHSKWGEWKWSKINSSTWQGFDGGYAPSGPPMPNNAAQGYQPMPQPPYPVPGQQQPMPGGYAVPPGSGGPVIMNQPHPGHQPIDNGSKCFAIYIISIMPRILNATNSWKLRECNNVNCDSLLIFPATINWNRCMASMTRFTIITF